MRRVAGIVFVVWGMMIPVVFSAGVAGGSSSSFPGKIFLETDRKIYIAGEDLFYKIDLVERAGSHVPAGEIVYLVLRNARSVTITHAMIRLHEKKAWGNLYLPDTLSTGMYQLVAYTNVMRNYGVESYYTGEVFIANRFDKDLTGIREYGKGGDTPAPAKSEDTIPVWQAGKGERLLQGLQVSTEREVYDPREKIGMRISYSPADNDTLVSLSVSVTESYSRLPAREDRRDWSAVESRKYAARGRHTTFFLPENNGYILRGKVLKGNGDTAPGVYVLLSVPDTVVNMDYAVTDSAGMFRFLLDDFYFGKKIILTPQHPDHPGKYNVMTENKFGISQLYKPTPFSFPPAFKEYLFRCQDIVGVQKIYESSIVLTGKTGDKEKRPRSLVYSRPTLTIVPAEYTPLNDLPEISREIIPLMKVRKNREGYAVRILNVPEQRFFRQNAALFLDGVPVDDFRQLVPLNSEQIRRIEIVGKMWFYGDIRFPGIVAVFTRDHAVGSYHFSPEVRTVHIEETAPFTTRALKTYDTYDARNSPLPDLRQVLCWYPDLVLRKGESRNLSFYSSDLTASYIVCVSGITRNGNKIVASTRFAVINEKKENARETTEGGEK